ncbi:MAG: succinate dehydrogenase flavoprotein subunit [Sedimenticola sp.]|uniref:Succinate dehydrogenase flavoprotein subunit n=1 Tax=Sedimenticola thiotaurini TaxID=1543721 RepID=A0A558CTD4_9GAMM|nr:succinate dehydrogenase flavoprotein subunit [Sedimenticola sp.]MCW8950300.1 succinate dehydrogenase flavoprotein subunit [Sedimenticola sp.]MCW8974944.1 succinate dehydrogenase flavoprotein subunit [Sedimenticola sp.]MCW9022637.1 succinate dehydrogenase flavoprotein subunit [Sedimenticola sp.]TVT51952.1 MAG: succinate dehydrogenase flavoprotein subunit [Sedimenticola thiotaurini]
MTLARRRFDALIIGAGGAGLNAALQLANANLRVAVVSKVFPTRSHTVAAQGGVNAALANVFEDNWHWHMFDTVKGSDYLGDQDAIEFMCREAIPTVYELEHNGVPFSRLDNGRIYQRAFGGQSQNFGGAQAARTCAAADRTGHAILHTLYQQNIRARTHFFDEYFGVDLIRDEEGAILGALTLEIETGEPLLIEAKTTLLATGGCGQVFRTTSNAHINTGDGMAMALRAGVPLMDMEFFQFHPTGISGRGMLITEGVRGEGGYLINKDGERFMERYAPNAKDLASRDVVARAIVTEVKEGRGCGPNADHVLLKVDHLGEDIIAKRLPGIRESSKIFAGVDPAVEPIPVFPTAHYVMGGIPTDRLGHVVIPSSDGSEEVVPGLYAAGECACVSVHGANRLGGNSLLDILVFGRAAGQQIITHLKDNPDYRPMSDEIIDKAVARLSRWEQEGEGISVRELRDEFRKVMEDHAGVFRTDEIMSEGVEKVKAVREKLKDVRLGDQSKVFNTARIEALELENLVDIGMSIVLSALERKESRGAHSRPDYTERDDVNWLKHSVYFQEGDRLDYKPVQTKPLTVDTFPPKPRVY